MITFKQFFVEQQELSLEDFSAEELQEFVQTEEYEQLDELSKTTLQSYIGKSVQDVGQKAFNAGVQRSDRLNPDTPAKVKKNVDKMNKRQQGIANAVRKLASESEQLDELSKTTLGNYIKKATTDTKGVATQTWVAGGATGADHDTKKKALNTANKRIAGIVKAAQKLASESEQLDEGGEKHAYRMGMQHGAKGQKKIDAEKSFGVFAKHYHRGYEQGKDAADWHDDKASKAPLSVRAKY